MTLNRVGEYRPFRELLEFALVLAACTETVRARLRRGGRAARSAPRSPAWTPAVGKRELTTVRIAMVGTGFDRHTQPYANHVLTSTEVG
jgi:hypothetical protein